MKNRVVLLRPDTPQSQTKMARWESHDWKRQTEMLRAECNALRLEKDVAVRMWEESSQDVQDTLRMAHSMFSSLQTFLTERQKIVQPNGNADIILQGKLGVLERTLQNLQSNSELRLKELKNCSNSESCRGGIGSIVRLVEEETQQWSQLQGTLHDLHQQLQSLQTSRKFWEHRALRASRHMSALHEAMRQWKQKAVLSENKVSHLQSEIAHLKNYFVVRSSQSSTNFFTGRLCSQGAELKPSDDSNGYEKRVKIDRPALEENGNKNWKNCEQGEMDMAICRVPRKYHISDPRSSVEEEYPGRPEIPLNDCAEQLAKMRINKKKIADRGKENLMHRSNGKAKSVKGS